MDLLVRAGVKRMTIGVESGNQRMLDLIKKDMTVEQASRPTAGSPRIRSCRSTCS